MSEFVVVTVTDEEAVLTLHYQAREPEQATLVNADGMWRIDDISAAPEPS